MTPRRLVPDHLALLSIAIALGGEVLLPLTLLPPAAVTGPAAWLGLALAASGLALEIAAARRMQAAGTTTRPNAPPSALVTSGPFRFSRNPFYLGLILLLGGLMVMLSLDWLVLAQPLLWLGLDRLVVPHEEALAATAFPAEWQAYAARTRRWL